MLEPSPTRTGLFKALFLPTWVRVSAVFGSAVAGIAAWDATSNQFDLPKLPALVMAMAALLPLWGWMMLFQSMLTFAALDAIRRQRLAPARTISDPRLDEVISKQQAIIDDYQRMCAIEARFNDALDKLKEAIQASAVQHDDNYAVLATKVGSVIALSEKVEMIRVDGSINSRDLAKLDEVVDKNAERVRQSFGALQNREIIQHLDREMRKIGEDLYSRLRGGETYSQIEWSTWLQTQAEWESNLRHWINVGRWYAFNVEDRIMSIKDSEFGGHWTVQDSQIPSAEGTRQFRRFRILQSHWLDVQPSVNDGMEKVAFIGLSERDVQYRPPTLT